MECVGTPSIDDYAGGGLEQPVHELEKRGLTAPGRAEQHHKLAWIHAEGDIGQGGAGEYPGTAWRRPQI